MLVCIVRSLQFVRMKDHIIHIPLFLSIFLICLPQYSHSSQQNNKYLDCTQPFNCGLLSNLYYPFWDDAERPFYCGGTDEFKLKCKPNQFPSLQFDSQVFQVPEINFPNYTMKMRRFRTALAYEYDTCPLAENTLSPLFYYTQNVYNITIFYDCPSNVSFRTNNFTCKGYNGRDGEKQYPDQHPDLSPFYAFYVEDTKLDQHPDLQRCKDRSQLQTLRSAPLKPGAGIYGLEEALESGFEVKYHDFDEYGDCERCRESKGECGRNETTDEYQFICHCPYGTEARYPCDPYHTTESEKTGRKSMVIIATTVSAALSFGLLIIIIFCFRRRSWSYKLNGLWKDKSKAHQDFEAFLRNHGPLAVRRYSYLEIKKMTNSFSEKLGQGGYGGVFKGKILGERVVAVKMLNRSKGNGDEFINEVASISGTSHVNIVTLLGLCFEGSKRALVYEYMANGSLEKFIHETNPTTVGKQLNCETLYQIAISVARGLEYLHRGCNTRIFHFDIKPHNILLDENFCPKISDFGLAKICPRNESMVSMLCARGTPGYIAPKVFSRSFGVVSHKSDVYSFGMMVLEMVGGRKNINVEVNCTSEIYFPYWIYKRLELNEELPLKNVTNESDKERMRKMVLVSLWCIQTDPSDRPTMHTVVDMLEGRVETLQIPPKPFLLSPSRSSRHSSIN